MSDEILRVLFTCDRYRADFPRGMPVRACLRRQLDRQESAKPGELGPPRKAFCAEECPVGREHLRTAKAAGVVAMACKACGSALIGGEAVACATCGERRLDAGKDVPRGSLPSSGPEKSQRIWTGEVPDVPIAPPSSGQTASLPAMRRLADERRQNFEQHERQAAARRASAEEQDHHQEEDEVMAKDVEKTCSKCGKKLRSDNTRGVCGSRCKAPGGAQAGGVKPAKEGKVTPLRPAAPRRASAMPSVSTQELLEQRAAIDEELRRRLAVAQDELVALKAAVGAG